MYGFIFDKNANFEAILFLNYEIFSIVQCLYIMYTKTKVLIIHFQYSNTRKSQKIGSYLIFMQKINFIVLSAA